MAGKNGVPPLFKDFAGKVWKRRPGELPHNAGRVAPEAEKNRFMKNGRALLPAITATVSSEIAAGKWNTALRALKGRPPWGERPLTGTCYLFSWAGSASC